jgi:hypothetical protein
MQIVPKMKTVRIQKMIKKYKEFQYNLAICTIVYTLFYKNKKNFFIFFKPWYNWYKLKKIVIPMLIRSFLYHRPLVQRGTIGTIVKKASNTNELRGRARVFYFYFINYKSWSIQNLWEDWRNPNIVM